MTYLKKKRARETYLAKRELFRCATYKPKIITNVTFPEYQDSAAMHRPIWHAA